MNETLLVGEIGTNGSGNLETTKKMISICHAFNVDYVKFQKRTLDKVYTQKELDTPRESPWGTTNREQKQGLEYSKEDYDEIDKYCKTLGIKWFASVWDVPSVNFIESYNVPFIKIPSALISHHELLNSVRRSGIPVIIATGMSEREEIDSAISILGDNLKYILHATSSYPTPVGEINLNKIKTLKELYGDKYKIGFSNHHQGTFFCTAAAVLGAEMIEFHITLDRASYGSDQAASIEPNGIRIITDHVKSLKDAMGDGEWRIEPSEIPVKNKLKRNLDF
jgi:N-acetylneuraminate synthase